MKVEDFLCPWCSRLLKPSEACNRSCAVAICECGHQWKVPVILDIHQYAILIESNFPFFDFSKSPWIMNLVSDDKAVKKAFMERERKRLNDRRIKDELFSFMRLPDKDVK